MPITAQVTKFRNVVPQDDPTYGTVYSIVGYTPEGVAVYRPVDGGPDGLILPAEAVAQGLIEFIE